MTYDPRDTDPLYVDDETLRILVRAQQRREQDPLFWEFDADAPTRKPGIPRPVLYYGIGALIVIVAVLVISGWVR